MRHLQYQYEMNLNFSQPAFRHHYSLRCFPRTDEIQTVDRQSIHLTPDIPFSVSEDSMGNQIVYGYIEKEHNEFHVNVRGTASVKENAFRIAASSGLSSFCRPTSGTMAGPAVLSYLKDLGLDASYSPEQAASLLQESLYRDMHYTPGCTNSYTTAEQAMQLQKGVCQDYAQIMLAALRSLHIPCRYMVGMIPGEGASHAWVEAAWDGYWHGYDPTNGRHVDDGYLVISTGHDARDSRMNTGVLCGGGLQTMSIYALVKDVDLF